MNYQTSQTRAYARYRSCALLWDRLERTTMLATAYSVIKTINGLQSSTKQVIPPSEGPTHVKRSGSIPDVAKFIVVGVNKKKVQDIMRW